MSAKDSPTEFATCQSDCDRVLMILHKLRLAAREANQPVYGGGEEWHYGSEAEARIARRGQEHWRENVRSLEAALTDLRWQLESLGMKGPQFQWREISEDEVDFAELRIIELKQSISLAQLEAARRLAAAPVNGCDVPISLSEAALWAHCSKRTLQNEELPVPIVRGGNGKPNRYRWRDLLPIIRKHNPDAPDEHPANPGRIIR